jgi:hypothetical protein
MAVNAGGRWVPAPGVSSTPPPLKRVEPEQRTLHWHGRRLALPSSAEIKIRGSRAWVRADGITVAFDRSGAVTLDPDEARMLASAEGWSLL